MFQSLKQSHRLKRGGCNWPDDSGNGSNDFILSYPFRTVLVNFHQFFISFSGTGACYKNKYCAAIIKSMIDTPKAAKDSKIPKTSKTTTESMQRLTPVMMEYFVFE